jgi:membrane-bound ClpP family serine protease
MDGMLWPLVLIGLGLLFLALELLVPSAGLLGVLAALAFLAAIIVGFMESPYVGTSSLVLIALLLPFCFYVFVNYWPHTPIGRRMLLRREPRSEEDDPAEDEAEQLRRLIGKRGRAKSKMLPSGAVSIDGQLYDATTQGGQPVEMGEPVEVIGTQFRSLVVRPVENDATPTPLPQEQPGDLLSQPLENFGLDNDPLG